jgi:hypothetical protein
MFVHIKLIFKIEEKILPILNNVLESITVWNKFDAQPHFCCIDVVYYLVLIKFSGIFGYTKQDEFHSILHLHL